jgi:hypothetical protein
MDDSTVVAEIDSRTPERNSLISCPRGDAVRGGREQPEKLSPG